MWGGGYREGGFFQHIPAPYPERSRCPGPAAAALRGHPSAVPAQNWPPRGPDIRACLPMRDLPTHAAGRGIPAGSTLPLGAAMLHYPGHGPPRLQQIKNTGFERSLPQERSTNRKVERPWSRLVMCQAPPSMRQAASLT